LLRYYQQFTKDYVENELPMIQGWAFLADAMENDGWLNFCGLTRVGDGYVKQETRKLIDQVKHLWGE
jgi:hypothetical protein